MRRITKLFVIPLLMLATAAEARLTIEITEGVEGAMPIAVVPFNEAGDKSAYPELAGIINADLARSGRFAPLAAEKLPGRPHDGKGIDFPSWRATGVENMVVGKIRAGSGDKLLVQFQLFDVLRGVQLTGYSIPTTADRLRRVAHQISDIVYEKLTGQRGAFNTHVAYVMVEQTAAQERRFRLAVADADGFGEQVILTSKQPLMSPAWSADGSRLAYVSFEQGRPVLYLQDIVSGKREAVASFKGLNSAPAWAPDGRHLALTLSRDGNPEVYILDLQSRALTRVTHSNAIDTEAGFAPDGASLVFTSDRGGRPQIYRVALSNYRPQGRAKRLTFEGDYNARASFSPDGSQLTMVSGDNNRFRIAVMELKRGTVRVLTDSRLDESPSFAPNGSMIIFATERNNRGILEAVSVDGRAHQRLGTSQGDVREPAWSPFISQ
jgi:TolB protein